MTGTTLDPARKYLVPVARLNLPTEPDDVHLSVYEWNPRLGEWLHGWAICGRSVEQGRLPDGTQVTCAKCLEAEPGYDKVLAEQARAAAERAVGATPAADLFAWIDRARDDHDKLAEVCRLLSQWAPHLMSATPVLWRKLDRLLTLTQPADDAPEES